MVPKIEETLECPTGPRGRLAAVWILLEPDMHLGKKDPENMVCGEMCLWGARVL